MHKASLFGFAILVLVQVVSTGCSRCLVIGGEGVPEIAFTVVPGSGSTENLQGTANHVNPCETGVAVFIFVNGWWNKPAFDQPVMKIDAYGSWSADITTGGYDAEVTKMAAFLIPLTYEVPILAGEPYLPDGLLDTAIAQCAIERMESGNRRLLYFSGHEWWVKSGENLGPGPNIFSDEAESVHVDEQGSLHLKIVKQGDVYTCAEIVSTESFGYGTYQWQLASRIDQLDKHVILGLFTWSDDPAYHYREIDFEAGFWGDSSSPNAQFVVQPWDAPGNLQRFSVGPDAPLVCGFTWQKDSVLFRCLSGDDFETDALDTLFSEWVYTGSDIPKSGDENTRINLWLMGGAPPSDGNKVEMVIQDFRFLKN